MFIPNIEKNDNWEDFTFMAVENLQRKEDQRKISILCSSIKVKT